MNYHAAQAASTALRWLCRLANSRCSSGVIGHALNTGRFAAYIAVSINNERR
jgi:hypothetical protein